VLGVRWTIGDVSDAGFEALCLSIEGAQRVFPPGTKMVVYVNTVSVAEARRRCGTSAREVEWRPAVPELPAWLAQSLDSGFAQGAAWKLVPLQAFPAMHELALDNDVILWDLPTGIRQWLARDDTCLVAADVAACFGMFAERCGPEPRNLGIRGLPPGFELERAMRNVLSEQPRQLTSELDEQGLQLAALAAAPCVHVVSLDDVTICSPFPPHLPGLGRCGAHFCGLNAKTLGWQLDGIPAEQHVRDHWHARRDLVAERVRGESHAETRP